MDAPYSDDEKARAEALLRSHGDLAERVAADILVDLLARGETEEAIVWLRVRRYLRIRCQMARHSRRLADKLMIAIEQAVSQGRFEIARDLAPIVTETHRHDDENRKSRRRRTDRDPED